MKNKYVYGTKVPTGEQSLPILDFVFEHRESVRIERTRSLGQKITLDYEDDDIAELIFEDGSSWIGNINDIEEIVGADRSKRSADEFEFPAVLYGKDQSRAKGGIFAKVLNIFRGKKKKGAAKLLASELATLVDEKLVAQEGLYLVDDNFQLSDNIDFKVKARAYLVLLHGTISNTIQSFDGLNADNTRVWKELRKAFAGRTLALEHYTLSKSVIENTLDLLRSLPDGIKIETLSGSRGGLIADILARCDHRNDLIGYSDDEIATMSADSKHQGDVMRELTVLAGKKGIEVGKVVRVACPGSGTTLLSRRLDHFLNALMFAIGALVGAGANPVYLAVKALLLNVIRERHNAESIPGLWSMVPDSTFQSIHNNIEKPIVGDLYVVEGDARFGGKFGHSLLVILTNLYYRKDNDFVVDTSRMQHGVKRSSGIMVFTSRDKTTHHLNYFNKDNSRAAIQEVLTAKSKSTVTLFTVPAMSAKARGVALELVTMKPVKVTNVTGLKPVVILLPGIMGSFISAEGRTVWINIARMFAGDLKHALGHDATDVEAVGLIDVYYEKLVRHLQITHDVVTLPYDWRLSVKAAALEFGDILDQLQNKKTLKHPVQIIAHSMGGLVVRQFMMDNPAEWKQYIQKENSRFLMLGTPWMGSYATMQLLTGHARKIKQLALIDAKHNKRELLDVFTKYPGVMELLPIDDRKFETLKFWKDVQKESEAKMVIPDKDVLSEFGQFKRRVAKANFNLENTYYIAGKKNETVNNYTIKDRFFRDGLIYLGTSEGDGTVTWESGIPKGLPNSKLYYATTEHAELANDPDLFDGITEIINSGDTSRISKNKPVGKRGLEITEVYEDAEPTSDVGELLNSIFNVGSEDEIDKIPVEQIDVSVMTGHLKMSRYPVVVGHFEGDGIVSAEGALDRQFNDRLSEKQNFGYYPGSIGDSEIIFDIKINPKGAIVAGLGEYGTLTPFLLTATIEQAVLRYAMFMRDNCEIVSYRRYADGLSCLLIGSGYGNLMIDDAIRGILLGISNANRKIIATQNDLTPIRNVEFVDYFEEKASSAYYALSMNREFDRRINYHLVPGVAKKYGSKQQGTLKGSGTWWHNFTTIAKTNDKNEVVAFEYSSSSGIARVERETVYIPSSQVEILLAKLSERGGWDSRVAKTLLELMIPNGFKEIFRNQRDILWKMDTHVAAWPWEMFHDTDSDAEPTFVNSGLIRQLYTDEYRERPVRSSRANALIIGDPIYNREGLGQLDAAKREAQKVYNVLNNAKFEAEALINKESCDIMCALYSQKYRFLHFAGHGLYDPENNQTGIAIGDGLLMTPAKFEQLPYAAELVFINCCYSGTVSAKDQAYYMDRYKLAANIGTQLIMMGVKAVVITGWAVDDDGAALFAETFYDLMINGYQFGDAVRIARKACYELNRSSNTWAAYQCYGDQFYTMTRGVRQSDRKEDYVLASQVHMALNNIYSDVSQRTEEEGDWVVDELNNILERAEANDLIDAEVRELEAMIYGELGMLEESYQAYQLLFANTNAEYSVRALEQYCNIRLKILMAKEEINIQDLEIITEDISSLQRIGVTKYRLCLAGNASKYGVQITTGKKRIAYLKAMRSNYQKAYDLVKIKVTVRSIHCFANFVTAAWLLSAQKGEKSLISQLSSYTSNPPDQFVLSVQNDLEIHQYEVHAVKEMRAHARLMILRLVVISRASNSTISAMRKAIVDLYRDMFDLAEMPQVVQREIAHINFLLTCKELTGAKRDNVVEIWNYLNTKA